jgi:methyl-accepting chemotaxis protein
MRLKNKLFIVPIISILSIVIIGIFMKNQAQLQVDDIDEIYNIRVSTLKDLSDIQQIISDNHLRVSNSIVLAILGEVEETINIVNINNDKSLDKINTIIDKRINYLTKKEKDIILNLKKTILDYHKLSKNVVNNSKIGDSYTASEMFPKSDKKYQDVLISLNSLIDLEQSLTKDTYTNVLQRVQVNSLYFFIIVSVLLLIIIIISVVINRDLSGFFEKIMFTLNDSGLEVSNVSSSVRSSSNLLENVSNNQVVKIEDMTEVINDAKLNMNTISSNIKSNLTFSTQMRDLAQVGYKELESLNLIIKDITSSSNEISDFVKTIEDISFQTNLLALNAAVESARAGEHGLGFAVVSEEVRALANRSNESSKKITELVSSSLSQSNEALDSSINTSKTFSDILTRIDEITSFIDKSSNISEKQENNINKIKSISEEILELSFTIKSDCMNLNKMSMTLENKSELMTNEINTVSKAI